MSIFVCHIALKTVLHGPFDIEKQIVHKRLIHNLLHTYTTIFYSLCIKNLLYILYLLWRCFGLLKPNCKIMIIAWLLRLCRWLHVARKTPLLVCRTVVNDIAAIHNKWNTIVTNTKTLSTLIVIVCLLLCSVVGSKFTLLKFFKCFGSTWSHIRYVQTFMQSQKTKLPK